MKFLRNLLDKVEPLFVDGGKLEKLYPLYEALDTFLYTPGQVTKTGAHVRDSLDMKRMMSMVIVALLPTIFMALYNTGYQANYLIENTNATHIEGWRHDVLTAIGYGDYDPNNFIGCMLHGAVWFLPIYIVTMTVGGTIELIFSIVRGHEINEGFLVTGMLYPLTLPATTPLTVTAAGIAFGVLIGKEIFGGTGKNFLNPALTARAYVYFAHAGYLSGTINPDGNGVWVAANMEAAGVDATTGATSLGRMADAPLETASQGVDAVMSGGVLDSADAVVANAQATSFTWFDALFGFMQGSMGETSALGCLIGAAILIATGIGSWRVMVGVVIGALASSSILFMFRDSLGIPTAYIPPHWHLVIGGFAFGTVYMATDPVSSTMTQVGMWWYGALIGFMTILIRVVNPAFAEGIMLAILFGNVFAPVIDYFVIQANITRRAARYGT